MNIPPEKIEEIKRQARQEVASKAGKAGVKANMAKILPKIMEERNLKTEEEAKAWYFSTIGKRGGRPKKHRETSNGQ